MLKVDDIMFGFGHSPIINGINAFFEPGLFHVIVGPNGSGKSTFLKIFSGELKPSSGDIFYDGASAFTLGKTAIARRRAVMSQQPELYFPLTVAEIVMMGRYPYFTYSPSKHDQDICRQAITKMELEAFAARDYLTLSGGEKQRVQFARVLAQIWEPPSTGCRYLFLDEPISNLDIHYQHQFLQLVRELAHENIVLIAVLHDINIAIQYADRILFMKRGRIVESGKPAQVITAAAIQDVFNVKVRILENISGDKPLVVFDS